MNLTDTLTIDGMKRTRDGYLVADVRAARIGIQTYRGGEVGKPEMATVSVYRPEASVFSKDAMASFTSIPVTLDHPPEAVTSDNWRKYAVGNTSEDIARDGEFIRVPIIVKDAAAISAISSGKRQLSMGYSCDLDWTPGQTADGFTYDAIQRNLSGNHLAIVSAARGGPALIIDGDSNVADLIKIIRDGVPVDVNQDAKILIDGLDAKIAKLTADLATANTQVGTLTATVSTKDGEIAGLNAKLTDATLTPAKLDAAVSARAKIIDAAKTILPTIDATGKTDIEIKRAAVAAKLGDAATAMDDAAIGGAFAVLSVTAADADPLRDAIAGIQTSAQNGTYQATVVAAKKMADGFNDWRKDN